LRAWNAMMASAWLKMMVALVVTSGASFSAGVIAEKPKHMPSVTRTHGDFGSLGEPRFTRGRPRPRPPAIDCADPALPVTPHALPQPTPVAAAPWARADVPRRSRPRMVPPPGNPEIDTTDLEPYPERVAGTDASVAAARPRASEDPGTRGLDATAEPRVTSSRPDDPYADL
jgi:hypothetical protein